MENNAHELQDCSVPPWKIYVKYDEGLKREKWFNKNKRKSIEKVTTPLLRGYKDVFFIYYPGVYKFIGILEELLANREVQGIRMCFGVDAFSDPPKRGKLDIVMAPCRLNGGRLQDIRALYTRASTLEKIDYGSAKKMTEYYKTNIVPKLQNTLSEDDITKRKFETENVYFEREYLELFIQETKCQLCQEAVVGVKGIKILFVSYHDQPEVRMGSIHLTKRMTIQFVYTDENGTNINLEKADPRYKNKPKNLGNFDTGDPTPPFDNYSDI